MGSFIHKNVQVLAGGIIQGFAMGLFLFPQYIPSGGAGGITVLLHYSFGLSTGIALWLVNFILLLFGIYVLGKRFAVWTLLAITVTSIAVGFFEQIHIPHRSVIIDLVFGSIFLGIGIGLLLRQHVSNGGIGVLALIMSKKYGMLPGHALFWINGCIFLFTAMIIDWKIIILALISQWIATRVANIIVQYSTGDVFLFSWRKKT